MHDLILIFDSELLIRELIREITGKWYEIEALVDRKTVLEVVAKDANTKEWSM